ncbi:MAG: hypothetical protein K2N58_03665 [Treponemataceae bacterium]|nr:hypothetical protein [Treponemataceae bacterium]
MNKLRTAIRNAEVDGLSDTLIRLFKADLKAQGDAFLKMTMERMETLSAQITTAILQNKTLSTLEAADSVRDEAVRTLGTLLAAYAVFPIASKKELAAPLKAIYDKYAKAGITSANYTSESSLIESLLGDLAEESLTDNIKGLEGIGEAVAAIRSAQDEFTKANDEYVKANTNKGASASSFNKPIVSLINEKLVPYLDAMVIAGNENCLEFAKGVDAEINRANDTIAKRTKKSTGE